jgi:protein TonB
MKSVDNTPAVMCRYGAWELKTGYRRTVLMSLVFALLLHTGAAVISLLLPAREFSDPPYRLLEFARNTRGLMPGIIAASGPSKEDTRDEDVLTMQSLSMPVEPRQPEIELRSPPQLTMIVDSGASIRENLRINRVAFRGGSSVKRPPMPGMLYDSVGADFPPMVRVKVQPYYPQQGLDYMYSAKVTVRALVGQTGYVSDAFVVMDSGVEMGFEESALRAVHQWQFRPATKRGDAVPMWIDIPIQFRLFFVYEQGFSPFRKVESQVVF